MTRRRALLALYVALVVISALVRPDDSTPAPEQSILTLAGDDTRIAWWPQPGDPGGPAVILLHGSPGSGAELRALASGLPATMGRDAIDLPGFGGSTMHRPDYSARAQAEAIAQWMDARDLDRAHFVAYSMGGAVALELWAAHPEKVASITMLAAIGAVELELLGDQGVNHGVHGAQLAAIEAATLFTPHFGLLDRWPLNRAYARSFYDTDQRRLRPILDAYPGPMLIVHGERDFLVPLAAAIEHHRIVPQSELVVLPTDHFLVFRADESRAVAAIVGDFIERVERGEATLRATASSERLAAASEPFDPSSTPPLTGPGLWVLGGVLALATFVSEDLTLIAGGLLVARGRLGLLAAVIACALGIFVGDVLLMLAGRGLGRAAVARPPLSWWVKPEALARASAWYRRHGARVILLSRFTPGMRLPMYVAAGVLDTSMARVTLLFAIASAVWTPLIVGAVAWAGEPAIAAIERGSLVVLALVVIAFALALRVLTPLVTRRGRRLARAWLLRQVRWEYWGSIRIYAPVLLEILRLGRRHGWTAFTAANPGMPAGGFVAESKWEIHRRFGGDACDFLPATARLDGDLAARRASARAFIDAHGWPVVLKPDAGQRGQGVIVARSDEEVDAYLEASVGVALIQAHVGGREFGVFYVRRPDEPRGRIFSITDKQPVAVIGDGRRTLEELILDHEVALPKAPLHLAVHAQRLAEVIPAGERFPLVEVGTHSRGALFLDAGHLVTDALTDAIDAISKRFDGGFYFGRYDLRAPSEEAFQRGEGLVVLELNGVTSEPTHMYDPRHSIVYAWKLLREQWRLAYEIGAANAARGAEVTSIRGLVREYRRYRREVLRGHVAVDRPLR